MHAVHIPGINMNSCVQRVVQIRSLALVKGRRGEGRAYVPNEGIVIMLIFGLNPRTCIKLRVSVQLHAICTQCCKPSS